MKNNYFKIALLLFCMASLNSFAQNTLLTELTGNPVVTDGWVAETNTPGETIEDLVEGDEIVLTQAQNSDRAAIYYEEPYSLTECANKWRVEFDFRMYDSAGEPADGIAFWYIDEQPAPGGEGGETLNIPDDANGLKVAFDTYDNDNNIGGTDNPEIQVGFGPEFSEADPFNYLLRSEVVESLRSPDYQHATIIWDDGNVEVIVEGTTYINGVPPTQPGAADFDTGYFGFSASTGGLNDRHSIKNVQVFVNDVILDSNDETIAQCDNDGDGFEIFDLTSVEDNITTNPELFFIYYNTLEDAEEGNNSNIDFDIIDSYPNSTAFTDETIYVRVINVFNCYEIAEIQLFLQDVSLLQESIDILGDCDDDQDQLVSFNLTDYSTSFITTPTDYNITFYTDLTGAQDEEPSALINNATDYSVTAGSTEIVFIRVEDPTTECFAIGEINLETSESPQIVNLPDLNECFSPGETLVFDLTVNNSAILGSQEANNFTISYSLTETAATNDGPSITFPNLFTLNSTGCQTLYARIESNTNESCFSVGSFEVCGNSVAIGNSSNLNACNNSIDLTSNEADLLDGEDPNDYNITYYSSQENADDSTNELTDVTNFNGCQTIYVRVESANNTSCYQTTTFEACVKEVNAGTANNLTACTANDDLTSFDLTLTENSILNGENYSLSFYESQTDAENFQNEISTPNNYQALNVTQTIYVRVENTPNSNCYEIVSFDIENISGVFSSTELSLEVCENEFDQIDLTSTEADLNLTPEESIQAYYTDLSDAQNLENEIPNPSAYAGASENDEFFVRIENSIEDVCYTIVQINLAPKICDLIIPDGFSPNADGMNDKFNISGLYENYNFNLKIYSLYGRVVYEGNNNKLPWDGSTGGDLLPVGTYFYVLDISAPDREVRKGWVYLNY